MNNFTIILAQPEGEINLGLTARSMINFSFSKLITVNPNIPIPSFESKRFAPHAEEILNSIRIVNSLAEIKKEFDLIIGFSRRKGQFRKQDFTLKELVEFLKPKISLSLSIGLLFGNETDGLSQSELEYTDFLCEIPSNPQFGSLNLSHATTIAMYELSHITIQKEHSNTATPEDIDKSVSSFLAFLEQTQYFDSSLKKKRSSSYFRKLFFRGIKDKYDADIVSNLFKRLSGKISKFQ
ncbi:MAG: RNA methyltransferase [Brevinemataceae bacterium]